MGYWHDGKYRQSDEQIERSELVQKAFRDELVEQEVVYSWHPSSGFTPIEVTTIPMGPDRMKVVQCRPIKEE